MKPANSIRQIISKSAAAFLLLLLIAITITQSLHRHNQTGFSNAAADSELIASANDCSICDYLVNVQSKYDIAEPTVSNFSAVPAIGDFVFFYIAGDFDNTHQSFVNKGPPALLRYLP